MFATVMFLHLTAVMMSRNRLDEDVDLEEGKQIVSPGQSRRSSAFSSAGFQVKAAVPSAGQQPYPAEIRQIKAALKVYGPD